MLVAVKNAKSAFYTIKKRQKKLSRKDARRKNRLEKKSKQHEYLLKKYSKEVEQVRLFLHFYILSRQKRFIFIYLFPMFIQGKYIQLENRAICSPNIAL